jgi:hypothetical protein
MERSLVASLVLKAAEAGDNANIIWGRIEHFIFSAGWDISGVPLRFSIREPVRSSTWMNTASHREDIPNNYHWKVFFQLVCVSRKTEICEEKMENDVKR